MEERARCFVIMPFGVKSVPDGGGRTYDFEKVYRVILCRAIEQAGMDPLRADEISGSQLIHTDMFKNLRDRPVVLADLSLANPNVYYELGIRHVMASRGTVLTCRSGTELPFDVRLSRVVFYDFDGESLDWEEVERVVRELQFALEEAQRQVPDSPVHALLEPVLAADEARGSELVPLGVTTTEGESLDVYQRMVAEQWAERGDEIEPLLARVGASVFGARAVGYSCLQRAALGEAAARTAQRLFDLGQYDLANRIYDELGDGLGWEDLLRYGSSLSEEHPDLAHTERSIELVQQAIQAVRARPVDDRSHDATHDLFTCEHKLAGLLTWKWQLSGQDEDLRSAIEALRTAAASSRRLEEAGELEEIGRAAQVRLRLLLLLRVLAGDRDRPDTERHREAILALEAGPEHSPQEVSYLRWYQAITFADAGDEESSHRLALLAFSEDAAMMHGEGAEDIGRKQYTLLRRFIDHYSSVLRHPTFVGHVSQVLHIGHGQRSTGQSLTPRGRAAL